RTRNVSRPSALLQPCCRRDRRQLAPLQPEFSSARNTCHAPGTARAKYIATHSSFPPIADRNIHVNLHDGDARRALRFYESFFVLANATDYDVHDSRARIKSATI